MEEKIKLAIIKIAELAALQGIDDSDVQYLFNKEGIPFEGIYEEYFEQQYDEIIAEYERYIY
jgi:hypothetical protein